MRHFLSKLLCIATIFALVEGHLVIAQTWAWASMLNERASERGLVEAVESTFSGAEPCVLCCAIEEQRQEQQREAPLPESDPTLKHYPSAKNRDIMVSPAVGLYVKRAPLICWDVITRHDLPATPPPRWRV